MAPGLQIILVPDLVAAHIDPPIFILASNISEKLWRSLYIAFTLFNLHYVSFIDTK